MSVRLAFFFGSKTSEAFTMRRETAAAGKNPEDSVRPSYREDALLVRGPVLRIVDLR